MILLMGLANVTGTQYLLPTKRQKEYTTSVTIGVIVNFIFNYILINLYKSVVAAIATVLSQLIVDIIQFNYIKNNISFKKLLKLAKKYFISAIIMFGVCFIVRVMLNMNFIANSINNLAIKLVLNKEYLKNIISIILQIVFGATTYIITLIILKDEYIFKFLNKIKNKIFKTKVSE